jgi:NADP+-dependent farnesol dehydrogenase
VKPLNASRLPSNSAARASAGGAAFPYSCDIGSEAEILRMFAAIQKDVGTLDVVINNAALAYQSSIADASTEDWRVAFDVNVLGTSLCIREALKQLANRQDTAIISILSMAAHRVPAGGYASYAASKHALRAIMEALRLELVATRSPTKVGSISPGTVVTDFHKLSARSEKDPTEAFDFERLRPDDIADAVVYMLSTPRRVQINDIHIRPIGQMG